MAAKIDALRLGAGTIFLEDFFKAHIVVATVLSAEKIEGADKLLKITLSDGTGERTVASGVAQHYTPEELIDKQVLLLENLAPRTLRGVESRGMILMASGENGPTLISPTKPVQPGSPVK